MELSYYFHYYNAITLKPLKRIGFKRKILKHNNN